MPKKTVKVKVDKKFVTLPVMAPSRLDWLTAEHKYGFAVIETGRGRKQKPLVRSWHQNHGPAFRKLNLLGGVNLEVVAIVG